MGSKRTGFSVKLAFWMSVFLLTINLIVGHILINHSRSAMKTLINNRMLDISKSAADLLNGELGDVLEKLKKEDKDTPEYRKINDFLAVFQRNIDLRYIYCIKDLGNKNFVFSVDPAPDPGDFGSPVVYTDALYKASLGESAVDENPYSDDWGRFYSSYSPIFNSKGKVAGIVAVDFAAEWYEEQIANQTRVIYISSLITIILAIILVFITTGKFRKQIGIINSDIKDVMDDIKDLTHKINPNAEIKQIEFKSSDGVLELSQHIAQIKDELHQYIHNLHTQANSMINALSSDYRGVYYIDLDKNEGICYQSYENLDNALGQGEHFSYKEVFSSYAKKYVSAKYIDKFLSFIDSNEIRKALAKERIISYKYMITRNNVEYYEMIRIAGVRHPEDRDDNIVHAVGVGFTDVDTETRKTLAQSQALSDALAAAESANKAKTAFLSNMSHEIRTPMNAIIGLNRIALSDKNILQNTRDNLEKIGVSAEHLLDIINEILDMTRIEAGKMILKEEVFSLSTLINQIDVIIGGQCKDKGLKWECQYKRNDNDYFVGDNTKLKQVLINILGNSVKFTPKDGSVKFSIEPITHFDNKTALRFIMKDTGIGMSKEFLPKLFEAFSQEDLTTKTKYGSTGLGMSITKSIIDMMNGEIKVDSEKNVGTTFTLTLTLTNSDQKPAEIEETNQVNGDNSAGSVNNNKKVELKGRRILLAEDMAVNAEIIKMVLSMREMKVEHAVNGKIAVDMFANSAEGYYDAVLMDMRMPEMDGLEAAKHIRAMDRDDAKVIPIIALTANAFEEDVQRSLQAGLNAHLSKPVEPETLFVTLESFIRP
ncbi:MAG: response regulator [Candidatus Riflebacteria bacterium]|nr:response regulator [Candidatus Riflebacteria bacterium]